MKQLKTIIKIYTKWKPNVKISAGTSASHNDWVRYIRAWTKKLGYHIKEQEDCFYVRDRSGKLYKIIFTSYRP